MKWFEKHTTDRNNLDARQIRSKFGIAGYGIYEVLQQIVAENMEGTDMSEWGFVGKDWTMEKLAEEAGVTPEEFRSFIQFCNERFIIERRNGRMFLPVMLERMNEYAKRQFRKSTQKKEDRKTEINKSPKSTENTNTMDNMDIPVSQHNTSQSHHNTTHHNKDNLQTAVAVADLNDLIALFKPVNPNYERLFPNKTQRAALERMVDKFTYEKIEKAILGAVNVYGKKYAPQITTPLQLEEKMGKLIAYIKSQQEEVPKVATMQ